MNIVVTQTAINASVSDQNISTSLTQTPISVSATISNISASLTQTQINSSVQQGSGISVSLYQTPINVTVSSGGGGGISDAPFDSLLYGRRNGAWANITGSGGGSSLPVADTQTIVMGSVDSTKLLRFEVDGFSAGATRVLTPPNQNATIAGLEVTNIFTVNQTVNAHAFVGLNSASVIANVYPFGETTVNIVGAAEEFTGNPGVTTYFDAVTAAQIVNPSANGTSSFFNGITAQIATESSNNKNIYGLTGVWGSTRHGSSGNLTQNLGLAFAAYNTGAGNISYMAGMQTTAAQDGSGQVSTLYGHYNYVEHYGGGTTSELYGSHTDIWFNGITTTAYGHRVSLTDDGGTTTTAYGLYIDDVNLATNNYAIYTGAGDVSFGDNLFLRTIKSGATQVAAGAAAGEVWKTNGHATLPNNVLMIGV